jgi:hypothetical protein
MFSKNLRFLSGLIYQRVVYLIGSELVKGKLGRRWEWHSLPGLENGETRGTHFWTGTRKYVFLFRRGGQLQAGSVIRGRCRRPPELASVRSSNGYAELWNESRKLR